MLITLFITEILLLMTASKVTSTEYECPVSCKCHKNDIFCFGDGVSLLPTDVPWTLITLYFRNYSTEDKTLSSRYINGTNITESLTMENIGIEDIEDGAFASLSKLKVLDLDSNYLSFLSGEAFRGLGILRELYLCNNKLTTFNDTFIHLPQLVLLDLTGNLITKFTAGMFTGIRRWYLQLILSSNKISDLTGEGLVLDTFFNKIDLSSNPLNNSGIELVTPSGIYIDLSRVGYRSMPFISASLTGLSLANNLIRRIRTIDTSKLSGDHSRFRHLNLDNNAISWIEYDSLAKFENLYALHLTNNRLSNISFQRPLSLRELHLDGNRIKEIPSFSFSNTTLIRFLILSENEIDTLYPCSFCGLMDLSVLNLKNNLIRVLPEGVFMNLDSLHSLQLQNNKIKKMEAGCFIGARRLTEINLSFLNSKIDFDEDTFDDMESLSVLRMQNSPYLVNKFLEYPRIYCRLTELTVLDISHNNLSTLHNSISTSLKRLRSIDLSFNKWNCDSNLLWLSNWMKSKPHIFLYSDDLNCSFPREMLSTPIASFSDSRRQETTLLPISSNGVKNDTFLYDLANTTVQILPTGYSYAQNPTVYSITWEPQNILFNGQHDTEEQRQLYNTSIRLTPSIGIIFGYSILGIVIFVLCIVGITFGFALYRKSHHWFSRSTRFPRFIFGNNGKSVTVGYENVTTVEQDLLTFDN